MTITLEKGDITTQKVDAIVNAANSTLLGGGGVDGAIHRAGGSAILEACLEITRRQGGCAVGEAVLTTAGRLPSGSVIHTVGPIWNGGSSNEAALLRNCYNNCLQLAEKNNLKSIAFPNISTGAYGFPKNQAAQIAIETVHSFNSENIEEVIFVCFDQENFELYQEYLKHV